MIFATLFGAGAPAWAESTTYDSLGRVISVITDDGKQTKYTYDAAGNRTIVQTVSTGVTQPPVAVDDAVNYSYGAAPPTLHPLTNDSDPNHLALTIVGISPPQFGAATFTASTVAYTPPVAHVGVVDSFAYIIQNSAGVTASAVIGVTLINPAPIANPDSIAVGQTLALTFDPRVNDSDPGGLTFTVTGVTSPGHGTAVVNSGGVSVTYTPTITYWGADAFNYTITNTAGLSASATVSATVTAAPPIAKPYAASTSENTAATFDPRVNDSDPNYLPMTITAVGVPAHGTAAINSGVSITYAPTGGYTGSDSFSYTVTNSGGGSAASSVNVTVQTPGPLSASASSGTWSWTRYGSNPAILHPTTVAANATGGQTPYSYAWQYVSGDNQMTAGAPTGMATGWLRAMPTYATYTSVWRCRVTDQLGAVAYTGNVAVTFDWENNN